MCVYVVIIIIINIYIFIIIIIKKIVCQRNIMEINMFSWVLFSDGREAAPDFSSSWTQQGTTR